MKDKEPINQSSSFTFRIVDGFVPFNLGSLTKTGVGIRAALDASGFYAIFQSTTDYSDHTRNILLLGFFGVTRFLSLANNLAMRDYNYTNK